MRISSFGMSDVGMRREKNEDSFLVNDDAMLYAVADGMGGHLGGDIASKIAAQTINEVIVALNSDPEALLQREGLSFKPGEYQGYLRYAIRLASQKIFEKSKSDPNLKGMGTTAVALLLRNKKAYIANVGDSRVYRIRGGEIVQITKDHSLVAEQIRAGIITDDDARIHRFKNIITRSVGFQEDVEADIDIRVIRAGDMFALCSDGLSNMLRDHEIRDVVVNNTLQASCSRLIDIANARGGDDNITVVLARIESVEDLPDLETEPLLDEPAAE